MVVLIELESKAYYFNEANGNFSMNYPMTKKCGLKAIKPVWLTLRCWVMSCFMVVNDAEDVILVTATGWRLNDKVVITIEELLCELESNL